MDCPYVWNAHAPAARRAGVSDALVDALRERRPLPPVSADEAAVVNYAMEFFQTHGPLTSRPSRQHWISLVPNT